MFPTSVQGLAGPIASQLPITPFNLVCTNVPGPQSPLYLLGHKMLEWYPYVPVRSEEHTSELQSQSNLVCRLLLEKKKAQSGRRPAAPAGSSCTRPSMCCQSRGSRP